LSRRRRGTSILCCFFFFKSGAQKVVAFAEFVCVCTKASSQKKDVNSDSLQSIFFCYSCLFVAFVASVVGLLSCVLFWVWVCSLIEM
jgi:hypothetical protein